MPPAGFEPAIPSRQAAADPRLRPLGRWDRLLLLLLLLLFLLLLLLLLLFTANGFVPGGSSPTTQKEQKITHVLKIMHNTQNYKHNKVHVLHTLKTQNGIIST